MPENPHIYRKVTIASIIMMLSVLLSRVMGLAREMVLAGVAGATGEVDAYQIAFIIPDILNHVIASGFMSVTFIPIFARYMANDNEDGGWRAFSNILFCFGSLLLVLVIVCVIFAPQLVNLLAPGMHNPDLLAKATRMTRIIMPAQLCFFAGGMLMAVQFAKEQFIFPALAPLVYNLGIIGGGLVLGPYVGVEGFAWGVLIGAIVGNLGLQIIGAKRVGLRIYPMFKLKNADLIKYTLITIPLILGVGITFSTEFVFRFFGSFLPSGGIAHLNYALRIMLLLVGFFGQAVGVASYPFMAKMAATNAWHQLNALLDKTIRYMSLLIPLSMLLYALRYEVVAILFQRGNFSLYDTMQTGDILGAYLVGAFAFALYTVVVRGFYAAQNTWFPALFGLIFLLASVPFYLYGLDIHGARGLAFVISVASIVQVAALYAIWSLRTKNLNAVKVGLFYLKIIVISIVAFAMIACFKYYVFGEFEALGAWHSLWICVVCGLVFAALGFIAGYVFKIDEIMFFFRKLLGRR